MKKVYIDYSIVLLYYCLARSKRHDNPAASENPMLNLTGIPSEVALAEVTEFDRGEVLEVLEAGQWYAYECTFRYGDVVCSGTIQGEGRNGEYNDIITDVTPLPRNEQDRHVPELDCVLAYSDNYERHLCQFDGSLYVVEMRRNHGDKHFNVVSGWAL
jgi:hypothetical protein